MMNEEVFLSFQTIEKRVGGLGCVSARIKEIVTFAVKRIEINDNLLSDTERGLDELLVV